MAETPEILVLGASGMLGSAVRRELARVPGWHVDGTQKEDPQAPGYLDILETPRDRWLARPYHYIVNCIGILKPAVDERDSASITRALRVNALFPHDLAAVAPASRILHLSTDGVFSGTADRPYLETDPTDCPDVYGKSKALGECPATNVLNLRCSIIGPDPQFGKGLVEWVLRSREDAELTGFEDHRWNGVTTRQFGELCRGIIESGAFERIRQESGTHHFCPNPATTKYDLLCAISKAAGRRITIRRGQSGTPGSRVLGSIHKQLGSIYSGRSNWEPVIQEALR